LFRTASFVLEKFKAKIREVFKNAIKNLRHAVSISQVLDPDKATDKIDNAPIIPVKDFYLLKTNQMTNLIIHSHGGHNGFIDGFLFSTWYERKMVEFSDGIVREDLGYPRLSLVPFQEVDVGQASEPFR